MPLPHGPHPAGRQRASGRLQVARWHPLRPVHMRTCLTHTLMHVRISKGPLQRACACTPGRRRYIVGTPSHSTAVLVIDTETDELRLLETGLAKVGRGYMCGGGVADGKGNVWAVPSDSPCVLKITPSTGEVRVLSLPFEAVRA